MSTRQGEPRFYRYWYRDSDLVSFNVIYKESDLHIQATRGLKRKAKKSLYKYRHLIEGYIERTPQFLTSLHPLPTNGNAPLIVQAMSEAARRAKVGPMAAVAGAIAESVGRDLLDWSPEVIVENGGDIFLKTEKKRVVGIYAGRSPLSRRVALEIAPEDTPLGICTSSATVGPSLSLGVADAVVVLSSSTPLADAAATATGNMVKGKDDLQKAIEFAKGIKGVRGVIIIKGEKMVIWGEIKFAENFFAPLCGASIKNK